MVIYGKACSPGLAEMFTFDYKHIPLQSSDDFPDFCSDSLRPKLIVSVWVACVWCVCVLV